MSTLPKEHQSGNLKMPTQQMSKRRKISFVANIDGKKKPFSLYGKHARTLALLITNGHRGLTPLDIFQWNTRLSDDIFRYREDQQLLIRTDMEEHSDGKHARYVLETPVTVVGGAYG